MSHHEGFNERIVVACANEPLWSKPRRSTKRFQGFGALATIGREVSAGPERDADSRQDQQTGSARESTRKKASWNGSAWDTARFLTCRVERLKALSGARRLALSHNNRPEAIRKPVHGSDGFKDTDRAGGYKHSSVQQESGCPRARCIGQGVPWPGKSQAARRATGVGARIAIMKPFRIERHPDGVKEGITRRDV